LKALEVFENLK